MATDVHCRSRRPILRWSARAHSIAEIETELSRIWASQDLTTEVDGELGRHVAARTSVMNLVVIARRPELRRALRGDDPAADRAPSVADDRHPVGRPRRAVLAGRPGRGALHPAARRRARDLRRDDPRHLRRRGRPSPRGDRDAADHPRPAGHGVVARRAAAAARPARRSAGGRGSARRRRLDVERRRPGPAARAGRAPGDDPARHQRLRARAPVTLARGDRLDLRRPGVPALPALAAADRGHVRHPRRDRGAGSARTWSSRSTTSAGWRRGSGWRSSSPCAHRWQPRAVDEPAGRRAQPADGGTRPRGDAVGRACRGRRRRPAGPVADARRTTLRVELLAERRGSELRADVTAEAETVHVRVWQDGVEALDRRSGRRDGPKSTCWPRPSSPGAGIRCGGCAAVGGAHRGRRRRPRAGRPWRAGGARARGSSAGDRARHRARARSGPALVVVRDPEAATDAAADHIAQALDAAVGHAGVAHWATTGGSTPVGHLPALRGRAAARRDPVGRRPRLVGRRPVRAARPPAVERQALRRHPARRRRRRGRHRR